MKRALLFVTLIVGVSGAEEQSFDLFEIGGNMAFRLDQEIYKDNTGISYSDNAGSVFPIMGDFKNDLGLNLGIGHTFSGRRADYGFLLKYYYRSSSEQEGARLVTTAGGSTLPRETVSSGFLREHDVLMTFRISSLIFPYDFMHLKNLYVDLGAGVSTVVYDYETGSRSVHFLNEDYYYIGPGDIFGPVTERKTSRSGLVFNVGLGYNIPLQETLDLTLRSDMLFGKIQNIEDNSGGMVHEGPNVHSLMLSVGLVKHFRSSF